MSKEKEENLKQCSNCLNYKNREDQFYADHTHDSLNADKRVVACKQCLWDMTDPDSISSVKRTLKKINRPFIDEVWNASIEEAKIKSSIFKKYMKNIQMNDKKFLSWEDSNFRNGSDTHDEIDSLEDSENIQTSEEVFKYWGRGYTNIDYEYLEEEKFKIMTSFECPDYGMEMIMRDICFINLDIEKIRRENKTNGHSDITKLIKARSDLMNNANMNPIQSTGAEANDQFSLGLFIKKWEDERPVPKAIDDDMKRYIDVYMVGHLAKMEGLNNDMTDKYDMAISEHTIDFKEINNDEDDDVI